jgi:hypothetical protein
MTQKTKKFLDFLPLLALLVSAIVLLVPRFSNDILLQKRHITGLVLLPIAFILLFFRHKIGVLVTGLIILLGLFGALSYSPAISTMTFGKSLDEGDSLPLLYFQPIFLLWLVLHIVVSGRYYTGIASKRYWENIHSDEAIQIGEP